MKTHSKKIFSTALAAIVLFGIMSLINAGSYHQQVIENDFIKMLKEKFSSYNEQLPEDRVYLQFDKPFYKPGETIWFSAYLRNGQNFKPSEQSDILHVEFIGPKGNIEKQLKLIAKNGKAAGDFDLGEEAPGGMYKVKAYTNWQKNERDSLFFEKELQVQSVILPNLKMKLDFERKAFGAGDEVIAKVELNTNENQPLANHQFKYAASLNGKKLVEDFAVTGNSGVMFVKFNLPANLKTSDGLLNILVDYEGQTESVSRSIPILLNNIKLTFHPEGGDLVTDLNSKVAFRALNEFGKPADVEGVVFNSSGKKLTTFSSFHQGMGAFNLKPERDETYYVKITKPEGIKEQFELPEAISRGYVLSADNSNPGEIALNISTTENEEMSVVAQVRGKVYYATALEVTTGETKLVIPAKKFPIGVAQLTLFDSKGIERAERLVFVNKNKQLNISVETDKEKYQPREKVKMTINVKDERGMPMPASLSLSVVNDQLLAFADDKSGNILSQLLLEQDLNDKVEEPSFYFSNKEPKADKALDYLMMTAGWRRYTWEKVIQNDLPQISYQGEKAIVAGTVVDYYTGKPVPKATVKISNTKTTIQTDEKGQFAFNTIDLSSAAMLTLTAEGYAPNNQSVNGYNQNLKLYLYDNRNQVYNKRLEVVADDLEMEMAPQRANGWAGNVPQMAENAERPRGKNAKAPQAAPQEFAQVVDLPQEKQEDNFEVMDAGVEMGEVIKADKRKDANHHAAAGKVFDGRAQRMMVAQEKKAMIAPVLYYRAKEFTAPVYDKEQVVDTRTDFRSTIFWNGDMEIDRTGKKVVEFYNSDDITSFRATVEGISADGMVGRTEKNYFTQLPFAMAVKIPVEVATEDIVSIPLTLKNNTNSTLTGHLSIKAPEGLKAMGNTATSHTIAANKTKTIYLDYKVLHTTGEGQFDIAFSGAGQSDAFTQKMKIVSKGFPVTASFSGNEKEKEYRVQMNNVVDGSISAQLTAYPSVVSDLMKGIEAILREPSGCFEQTSMSSYPNIMVMDYLKTTDSKDAKLMASAERLVDKGYKRLVTFETKEKGYEWFGGAPAHEALTAYGLMQFNDMKNVYGSVDQKMLDRTADWLMARKDGNGGFKRNKRALDNFGGASEEITNAYIVYALTESGYKNIDKELDQVYSKAMSSKDPYQLGLVANALYKVKDIKRGEKVLDALYNKQSKDGSWNGLTHSVTRSTGKSLLIETTSLAVMAMLKSGVADQEKLRKAVEFIVSSRSGYGAFGSTQGTILALKALTEYAKHSKHTSENGVIEFYVNGRKVAEKAYIAGEKEAIVLDGLEKFLKPGKHDLKIKYAGTKNPMPYSLAVSWNTFLPTSSQECMVDLSTKLAAKTVTVGETVRLAATLQNTTNEGLPSTMAIIGIPAGLSVQPWQLKELQEKKVFDYYEVSGNNVFVYYRQMAPSETKTINLDLKAEIPGIYDAPASTAYLYYTNEFKCWTSLDKVTVVK